MATQLTGRGIMIVILCFVILMGVIFLLPLFLSPDHARSASDRQFLIATGVITALAIVWLAWLIYRSIQDHRRGIERTPARVSGWFHVWFGAAVAVAGAVCSLLSYRNAVDPGQGIWTLYWGMIVWGLLQMAVGGIKIRAQW
ncbi:MAG TPA: hypothetical protein VGP94_00590 [Tepidisphaeraceae bacterium]|jgi:quinol-cytochrome oxidoreductase complex cytochrome b subunit|nr:hypothetical protein [Tepidisphaeraceae bacterium]